MFPYIVTPRIYWPTCVGLCGFEPQFEGFCKLVLDVPGAPLSGKVVLQISHQLAILGYEYRPLMFE